MECNLKTNLGLSDYTAEAQANKRGGFNPLANRYVRTLPS
jgi:hypothetical protein